MTTVVEPRTGVDLRRYVDDMKQFLGGTYDGACVGDVEKVMKNVAHLAGVLRTVNAVLANDTKVRDKNHTDPYSGKRGRGVQLDEVAQRAYDDGCEILFLLRAEISIGNTEDPRQRVFAADTLVDIERGARGIVFHFNEWCDRTPWSR